MTKGDSTDIACHGLSTGTAQVHVTGGSAASKPYKYQLDGTTESAYTSNADSTFTGLAAGTHTIKVTDNCGVSQTLTFNLKQPAELAMTKGDSTDIACHGLSTGTAQVHVTGGSTAAKPYKYQLDSESESAYTSNADSTFQTVRLLTLFTVEVRVLVVVVLLTMTVTELIPRAVAAPLDGVHQVVLAEERQGTEDVRLVDGADPTFQLCQRQWQHRGR